MVASALCAARHRSAAGRGSTVKEADTDSGIRTRHWDGVYTRHGDTDVSWFEPEPTCSLQLLAAVGATADHAVIDLGAGASRLVDTLLERGFGDVTALDVSEDGLALARARLVTPTSQLPEHPAGRVRWVVADLLEWTPPRRYDVWHDRAVFHFLTDPADRLRYRALLDAALGLGSSLIVGAFAADGPQSCSGLPTARYDIPALVEALGGGEIIASHREEHVTPGGAVQPFTWVALRRS